MKETITLQKRLVMLLLFLAATTYAQAPAVYFTSQSSSMSGIWLEMTTQLGNYCQTAVGYSAETTEAFDDGWDTHLQYDGPAVLYTVADNIKLAVQAKGAFRADDVTQLRYKAAYGGTFTMSIANKTGVFAAGQNVYLRDKVAGTLTNLCQQAYFFTTAAGTFDDRFDIVYTTDATLAVDSPVAEASSIIMYRDGNSLNIDAGSVAMNDVKVYDMNGRLLRQSGGMNGTRAVIDAIYAERQVLLVQIGTNSGVVNKKIVF